MEYENYIVEDFVLDDSFQRWVQEPDEETSMFWEGWSKENPGKIHLIKEAREIIQAVRFDEIKMPAQTASDMWQTLHSATITEHQNQGQTFTGSGWAHFYFHNWRNLAAAVTGIMLICSAILFFVQYTPTTTYTTGNGETKKVVLPDGSTIILNANSTLEFISDWQANTIREVLLEGEAFFSVVHTSNHQKFIVKTNSPFDVEVLGTEFNISKRERLTRVVLNSGSVKLNPVAEENNTRQQSVTMKPGELVEIENHSQLYTRKMVNPEVYLSWKNNKLLLDNTSLGEIAALLEDNYGLEVKISNPKLVEQKVSGSMPLGNVDNLLNQIAEIFEVKISRTNKVITIQN